MGSLRAGKQRYGGYAMKRLNEIDPNTIEAIAESMYKASCQYWEHVVPDNDWNGEGHPEWNHLTPEERGDYLWQLATVFVEMGERGFFE